MRLDWRVNERHYGALTGLLKAEAVARFADIAVQYRRCFYQGKPSAMVTVGEYNAVKAWCFPNGTGTIIPDAELLAQTVQRVASIWSDSIAPTLQAENASLS